MTFFEAGHDGSGLDCWLQVHLLAGVVLWAGPTEPCQQLAFILQNLSFKAHLVSWRVRPILYTALAYPAGEVYK